jgi:hypothetical protein
MGSDRENSRIGMRWAGNSASPGADRLGDFFVIRTRLFGILQRNKRQFGLRR